MVPGYENNVIESGIFWLIAVGLLPFLMVSLILINVIYRGMPLRNLLIRTSQWGPALNRYRKLDPRRFNLTSQGGSATDISEETQTGKSPSNPPAKHPEKSQSEKSTPRSLTKSQNPDKKSESAPSKSSGKM